MTPAEDLAYTIAEAHRVWSGPMPVGVRDHDTRRRVEGAAFTLVAAIDSGGEAEPVALCPKTAPDVDIAGGLLHELLWADVLTELNQQERTFIEQIRRLVNEVDTSQSADVAVREFLDAYCELIAEHYLVKPLEIDEEGEVVGEGEDFAADLPGAFKRVMDQ